MLVDIHERICGNDSGGRVLVGKAMREGYYWPHALKDAEEYVRRCKKCQEYSRVPHHPSKKLTLITSH